MTSTTTSSVFCASRLPTTGEPILIDATSRAIWRAPSP